MIESIADLVAFLKRFHRRRLPDPSLDPACIPADLPPGLAMLYRELGSLVALEAGDGGEERAPFSGQDMLLPAHGLRRIDGMVEFALENQECWSARFPIGPADPPVFSDAPSLWSDATPGFVEVCDSLDHFLITLCLQEAVMSCGNVWATRARRSPEMPLAVPFEPLWLDGRFVHGDDLRSFHYSAESEVLMMDMGKLWFGSPTGDLQVFAKPGVDLRRV